MRPHQNVWHYRSLRALARTDTGVPPAFDSTLLDAKQKGIYRKIANAVQGISRANPTLYFSLDDIDLNSSRYTPPFSFKRWGGSSMQTSPRKSSRAVHLNNTNDITALQSILGRNRRKYCSVIYRWCSLHRRCLLRYCRAVGDTFK